MSKMKAKTPSASSGIEQASSPELDVGHRAQSCTTPVTDYVCGRVLFQYRQWLDREIIRLRELGKDESANLLNMALSALDNQLNAQPLALQHLQALTIAERDSHNAPRAASTDDTDTSDRERAALFDPVTIAVLESMFPTKGRWKSWADHAKRNGLIKARAAPGKFNPYRAGLWFLEQGMAGWSHEVVMRKLAKNLPARSRDQDHLITNKLDFEK